MKTSRLLAYGALGMIAGLLLENKALILKQLSKEKVQKLKKKVATHTHHN